MRSLLVAAVALVALPAPADACDRAGNSSWRSDEPIAGDTTPPSVPTAEVIGVTRSEERSGCGTMSSCGNSAIIALAVSSTDDRATVAQIGYEITIVGGDPPRGFNPEERGRVIPALDDTLVFDFAFDAGSFSMDLEIRAVDANGNVGEPTLVTVEDFVDDGGCRAGGNVVGFGMLAFATAFAMRKRR